MSAPIDSGDQFSDESRSNDCDFHLTKSAESIDNKSLTINDSGVDCLDENKVCYNKPEANDSYNNNNVNSYHSNYYYSTNYQPYHYDNYNATYNQNQLMMNYNSGYYNYNAGNFGSNFYGKSSPVQCDSFSSSTNTSSGFLNSSLLSSSIDSGKSVTPPPSTITPTSAQSTLSMPLSVQTDSSSSITNTTPNTTSNSIPKHSSPSLITTCAPIQLNNNSCANYQFQADFTFNANNQNVYNSYYENPNFNQYSYKFNEAQTMNSNLANFNNQTATLSKSESNDQIILNKVIAENDENLENEKDFDEDDDDEDDQQNDADMPDGKKKQSFDQKKDQPPSKKYKRRTRTTFTKTQLEVLESTFQKAQYPDIKLVDHLTSYLNLSIERVNIWFQNRRARLKKEKKLLSTANAKQQEKSNYINTSGLNISSMPVVSYASIQSNFRSIASSADDKSSAQRCPPNNSQQIKPSYTSVPSNPNYFSQQQQQQQTPLYQQKFVNNELYQMKPSSFSYFNQYDSNQTMSLASFNSSFSSGSASFYSSPSSASSSSLSTSSSPLLSNVLALS